MEDVANLNVRESEETEKYDQKYDNGIIVKTIIKKCQIVLNIDLGM